MPRSHNIHDIDFQLAHYARLPCELDLDYLPASFDAASKQHASSCLQHTREQVLADIRTWIDHDSERGIYWLNGMAGTGKSTISLTIAREYYKKKQLGASFFFSRGGGDLASTKKFATTVAVQLSEYSPVIRQHIIDAAASNPRISHLTLYDQWEKLILKPLGLLEPNTVQSPLLIIVDALDECDNEKEIAILVECFTSTVASVKSIPLRIFVTSRPDRPINIVFGNISVNTRRCFALHNIEQAIVDDDLKIYYQHQLTRLSQRHSWDESAISDNVIQSLVKKSHGLFIYAATTCRFINEGGILAEQRLLTLCYSGSSIFAAEQDLDCIYTTVLEYSLSGKICPGEAIMLQQRFQKVVGSIMILFDAFTLGDLVTIIGEPRSMVMSMLNNLGSVLDISEDDEKQINILHPSFRDFLLDSARCSNKRFAISTKQLHYDLFERCLAIMHSSLHKDMCELKRPAAKARDVSRTQVDKFIPLPVQYACSYWMKHLQKSEKSWINHRGMVNFFQADFLGWLEALALLGRLSEGMTMLAGLQSSLEYKTEGNNSQASNQSLWKWIRWPQMKENAGPATNRASSTAQSLGDLIRDAKRFAFQHSQIIEEAPLQVYCSALLFSPEQSVIRRIHNSQIPNWITPSFQRRDTWAPYTQILWHPHSPSSFAFSPDGTHLASGCSNGAVWIWNVVTGAIQRILESHSKPHYIFSVDFSPKGHLIASGLNDGTIRLWNFTTGTALGVLSLGETVYHVAFSPDGASLVSLSHEHGGLKSRIRLWNIVSRDEQWNIQNLHYLTTVLFLSDGELIVYSGQNETGLLDARTGQPVRILAAYGGHTCSSKLSSSGQMIGLGTDSLVELYAAQTNSKQWYIRAEFVKGMAFSPDDRVLATAYKDRIELLDAVSGYKRHTIDCFTSGVIRPGRIAFSSDGAFLATCLSDQTIRFWDTTMGKRQSVTDSYFSRLCLGINSGCGKFFALISPEAGRLHSTRGHLCIWDTHSMAMLNVFSLASWRGVENMTFSLNAQFIAVQSEVENYDLFDCKTGKHIISRNGVKQNIFSPDSQLFALWTIDHFVQIWDTQSMAMVHEIQAINQSHPALAFSLDSKRIVVTTTDEQLCILNLGAIVVLNKLKGSFERIKQMKFLTRDRILLLNGEALGNPPRIQLLDTHAGTILHVIKLTHKEFSSYRLISFPTVDVLFIIINHETCEIWDLETGTFRTTFEMDEYIHDVHLLSCKVHFRINEAIMPLSTSDPSTCHSHGASFERFWIKHGDEKLVFVPQDYASALMTVRDKGASFQPFSIRDWSRSTPSQLINTLKFDFSMNGNFV